MTCAPAIEFKTHRMEVVDNMAREYGKVWFSIFTDEHFTAQPAVDKLLYIALIAQPSLNYAGVQPINMRRLRKAMRDGNSIPTERELELSLLRMERLGYVYTDEDTGEILVRSFMRRDEIDKQPNVLKSALRALSQIESHKLAHVMRGELARLTTPPVKSEKIRDEIARLWTTAMTHLEGLAEGITEPLPEPFTEGLAEPLLRPGETEGLPEPLAEGLPEGSVVVEVEVVKSPTAFTQVLEKKNLSESSMSNAPRNTYPAEFERFWAAYPKREQKRDALKAWQAAIKRASNEELIDGATRYARDPNRESQYTKLPAGWLRGDMWLDGPIAGKNSNQVRDGKSGLLVER